MRQRRWQCALVVLALLAAAVPVLPAGAGTRARPPKQWDPRIEPFVEFVEHERGLKFDHPVPVRVLDDAAFLDALSDGEPTSRARREATEFVQVMRALALVDQEFDVFAATNAWDAEGVVGYYDSETEEIVIREGTFDDVETQVTLVHELTHTLQDQRFDLDRVAKKAKTGGASTVLDLLAEGDATLVEWAYVDSLSAAEQDAYDNAPGPVAEHDASVEAVPAIVVAALDLPYALGPAYVDLLMSTGKDALDQAFRRPADTEVVVLDPVAAVQQQRFLKVKTPTLSDGEERVGKPDDLGALTLYSMMATRTDIATALRAVTGYRGDRSVHFRRGEQDCVRARVATDGVDDTSELLDGLQRWAATLPAGTATAERDGDRAVLLTSCAVTGITPPTNEQLERALGFTLNLRIGLTKEFVDAGAAVGVARCTADVVLGDPKTGPMMMGMLENGTSADDLGDADRRTLTGVVRNGVEECRDARR